MLTCIRLVYRGGANRLQRLIAARSASVQAAAVTRYRPAASGTIAAISSDPNGMTLLSRPAARSAAAVWVAVIWVWVWGWVRRAARSAATPMTASSTNSPANTAPCALTGPAPPSHQLPSGLVFAGLFVLLAVAGLAALRTARRTQAKAGPAAATGTGPADRVAGLLGRVMPFGSLLMAAIVPLAAGLYLLTTATWTLAERTAINRWSRVARRG